MLFEVKTVKVAVMTPPELVDSMRKAACEAGAGVIGDYSWCTITTDITGSFVGGENTDPYIGEKGKLELVKEVKLEFICPVEKVKTVLTAIRAAHPYEEPGIDLYPLLDEADF